MCFTQVVTMSVTTATITNEKCHFQDHSLRYNQTTLLPQGVNHPRCGNVSVYHLDFILMKVKSKSLWTSILCHFLQAQKGFELAKAQADKKRILSLTNFSFFSPPLLLYQRWQLMLIQNHTKVKFATRKYVNPLIPESDQDRISPYNINTTSNR